MISTKHALLGLAITSILTFGTENPSRLEWQVVRIMGALSASYLAAPVLGVKFDHLEAGDRPELDGDEEFDVVEFTTTILNKRIAQVTAQFQEQIKVLQFRHEAEKQSLTQQFNQKIQGLVSDRSQSQHQIQRERELLLHQFQQEQQALIQERQELYHDLDKAKQEAETQLEQTRQLALEELNEQMQQLREEYEIEIAHLQQENAALYQKLSDAIQVKRSNEASLAGHIANILIENLWGFNIPVDYEASFQDGDRLLIHLRPREHIEGYKLTRALNDVKDWIDGIQSITHKMSGGLIKFSVVPLVKLETRKSDSIPIFLDGYDYITQLAIPNSNHHLIMGESGGGKSVLASNLADAMAADMKDYIQSRSDWNIEIIPEVSIQICDPKYPDSEWFISGQPVTPQYRGFQRWLAPDNSVSPSAIDGAQEIGLEVHRRLHTSLLIDWLDQDSRPERNILIGIIDEAEQMVCFEDKKAKPVSGQIGFVSRVGRSQLCGLVVMGQNTNAHQGYGIPVPSLNNFTQWYLGEAIQAGIERQCKSAAEKKKYQAQLSKLQQEATTADGGEEWKRFFALVKIPRQRAVFVYLPPPAYFSGGLQTARQGVKQELSPLVERDWHEASPTFALHEIDELAHGIYNLDRLSKKQRDALEDIGYDQEERRQQYLQNRFDAGLGTPRTGRPSGAGSEDTDDDTDNTGGSQSDLERLEALMNADMPPLQPEKFPHRGAEFLGYLQTRLHMMDENGCFSVARLRDNWAKDKGMNTDTFRAFLNAMNAAGAGRWWDAGKTLWFSNVFFERE